MKLIFSDGVCIGTSLDPLAAGFDAPDDFNPDFISCYSIYRNKLKFDEAKALDILKARQIAQIKAQATQLISATDWKLQRAQERDAAGWGSLAEIDAVLVEREMIRRSSNEAEAAVYALTDAAAIATFSWVISATVELPKRLTRGQFLDRFTPAETEQILTAANSNVALKRWVMRLENSEWVKPDEARTGLHALEIAGLLQPGRAAQILA